MLQKLTVKNFAIIDNISIDFKEGFTSITGETGAGKSLLIDAINILLGERASTSMIRTGEQKASIEGLFVNISEDTKSLIEEYGLDDIDDDCLVIRKDMNINGKSLVRINGSIVNMSQLESIASTLADIHTQNDTKKLFEPKNYLSFIDNDETKSILVEYQKLRKNFITKYNDYENLSNKIKEYQKEHDLLQYQLEEIENANLKQNELEDLEEELNVLSNFEHIYKNLSLIIKTFKENNISDNLYEVLTLLEKISNMDNQFNDKLENIKNSYYEINDIETSLAHYLKNYDFDENRFNDINERIAFIKNLTRKYKMSVNEIIDYHKVIKEKLELVSDQDYLISKTKEDYLNSYEYLKECAIKLSLKRIENANLLKDSIKESLKDLLLDKVNINFAFNNNLEKIGMTPSSFGINGIDQVNIMISFNPGEPLKELSKVASGGEMSRVMLSIKTHLMSNLKLSTMIFDEIDSGVSGEVAYQVAKKLKEISKYTQVLAITHLPVVASMAEQQLFISKKVVDNLTVTSIEELDYNRRIDVISNLISPTDNSGKSRELAVQMLKND